jgi:hypothetical protein
MVFTIDAVNFPPNSAHPLDTVRIFRMAEEPAPALVTTPHEHKKPYCIKRFDQEGRDLLRAILQPS